MFGSVKPQNNFIINEKETKINVREAKVKENEKKYKDSLKTLGDKEKCPKEIKKKDNTVADLNRIESDEMEKNISAENKGKGN